jgi:hypothetical protein
MPFDPSLTPLFIIALAAFIGWRITVRIRRLVGRQRLARVRPWLTVVFFPLLVLLLAAVSLPRPLGEAILLVGVALGVLLAQYGLRKTRFEVTTEGWFYTPDARVGVALSMLLVARIGYRFYEIYTLGPALAGGNADFARSPLTLGLFGLLAGYYSAFTFGLLRWKRATPRPA